MPTAPSRYGTALYEVLADGYHTALTKTQVEDLFQAGRISRNTPCKRIEADQWCTIDQLFPLLKYESSGWSESKELFCESRKSSRVLLACVLAAIALSASAYVAIQHRPRTLPAVAELPVVHTFAASQDASTTVATPSQPVWSGYSRHQMTTTTAATNGRVVAPAVRIAAAPAQPTAAVVMPAARPVPPAETYHDVVVEFDKAVLVQVGGMSVSLKIHDNDVTSFDVWVNGGLRRNVKKEKGISHTGTDETLIYSTGNASLYYVWEISGTLNHCLLRVREL